MVDAANERIGIIVSELVGLSWLLPLDAVCFQFPLCPSWVYVLKQPRWVCVSVSLLTGLASKRTVD